MYNRAKPFAEEAYGLGNGEVAKKILHGIDSFLNIQKERVNIK